MKPLVTCKPVTTEHVMQVFLELRSHWEVPSALFMVFPAHTYDQDQLVFIEPPQATGC